MERFLENTKWFWNKYLPYRLKKRIKRYLRRVNKKKKNENRVQVVIDHTGWTRKEAIQNMDRAKELLGADYQDYVNYHFWELDEETQATYITKEDTDALRDKYNTDKRGIRHFWNKRMFNETFEKYLGRTWLKTQSMSLEEFKTKFANEEKIIYKPLLACCGRGIAVFELNQGNMEDVYNKITKFPNGVIEGYLKQHAQMCKLSKKSVNTIRIISLRAFGEVNLLYATCRMGGGDSLVDNFHAGGVLALVDIQKGELATEAIDINGKAYDKHPVTQEKIVGFQIPYWNEIVKMIKEAAIIVDGVGCVGWDVAITENGPVLIEGNSAPSHYGLQMHYARQKKGMKHIIQKYL